MNAHEVLYLSYEVMHEGTLFLKEIVFGSDHCVFSKVSWLEENQDEDSFRSYGWRQLCGSDGAPICWSSKETLEILADKMDKKGWNVMWHPIENPLMEDLVHATPFEY